MKKSIFYIFTFILFIILLFFYLKTDSNIDNKVNTEDWITDITLEIKNVETEFNIIENILNVFIEEEKVITDIKKVITDIKKNNHIETPENVRALYYSANAVNNEDKLNNFINIIKTKEVNSIMIDLKEVDWYTNFELNDSYFTDIKPSSNKKIKNIEELLRKFHDEWIYVIARIAVFKDKRLAEVRPDLSVKWISDWTAWHDYNWFKYTDQYSKEVWKYHSELWIAAYELGFDEINYDYVRFPTDWYISQAYYPFAKEIISKDIKWWKVKVIDAFSSYITSSLKEYDSNIVTSADVFWLVTDYTMFGIGQNLESFLLYFDFVGPMIYPSHYWEWYYWYKYPDNNPYEIINIALNNAIEKIDVLNTEINNSIIEKREVKLNENFWYDNQILENKNISVKNLRPYLQWFSCTRCNNYTLYNRVKFRKAVKWINDAWLDSWWVRSAGWNYKNDRFNVDVLKTNVKKDEK